MRSIEKTPCPVCKSLNIETTWTGDYGRIEEDYYDCSVCSYFYIMAYSEPMEGIVEGYPEEYKDKVARMKLTVVEELERARLPF